MESYIEKKSAKKRLLETLNKLEIKFSITDSVYLITDTAQIERLVTGVKINENHVMYELSQGTESSLHYHYEIEREVDEVKKLNLN